MDKREVRRKVKALRQMLSEEERFSAAEEVFGHLEKTAAFLMAEHILMYHSLPDELYTHSFLRKWHERKHFYLPRVNGVNLEILPYEQTRLELGAFHIEEPTGEDCVDPAEIDMIVVPAVAYDRRGNRLGRGKGFYDRLLSTTKATKVGVGYDFQLLEELPTEEHDIPMDIIITQNGIIVLNS